MKPETKDEALQRVMDNNFPEFSRLYDFAVIWVKTIMVRFTSEDLRIAFLTSHPEVKNLNIYGSVMSNLAKDKLILSVLDDEGEQRTRKAKLPQAKSRRLGLWISREYSEKQRNNRTLNSKSQLLIFARP